MSSLRLGNSTACQTLAWYFERWLFFVVCVTVTAATWIASPYRKGRYCSNSALGKAPRIAHVHGTTALFIRLSMCMQLFKRQNQPSIVYYWKSRTNCSCTHTRAILLALLPLVISTSASASHANHHRGPSAYPGYEINPPLDVTCHLSHIGASRDRWGEELHDL